MATTRIDSARGRTVPLRAHLARLAPAAAVSGIVVSAGVLALVFAVRATHWAVMTDELQTAKLATSIAETLSPVPHVHGVFFAALSQLYPLLMAPFYGTLSPPAAATAVHALNGFLLASAAVPAYLLARSVTGSRPAAVVAAALTAFTPWLVLASTLLTENAAYPAFAWSAYLCYRTLASPSALADLAALGGLAVAFLARTQLILLAVALPVLLLGHEVGFAVAGAGRGGRVGAARAALRHAVSAHRVLAGGYAAGGTVAVALAARGSLESVVGTYADVFRGPLLPHGLWRSAAIHLDHVVTGIAVAPFLLAASWALAALLRPERKAAHAFAVMLVVLVPALTLEVTSFDLRYAGHGFEQDRYLFYVVPLLAVGAAAALTQTRHAVLRASLLVAVAGAFAAVDTVVFYRHTVIFWASPAAAFHPALAAAAHTLGVSAGTFVRVAALVLAGALAVALVRGPRLATLATCGVALAAFGAFEAGWIFHRYAVPSLTVRSHDAARRDWVDAAVPGRSVALVPSPWVPAVSWWETEFWNRDVDRVLRVDRGQTYTPFPADRTTVDFVRGALRGPQPRSLLVVARDETRFALAGGRRVATTHSLSLVRSPRPYRLAWATRGAAADGWIPTGRRATIRLFAHGEPLRRLVSVTATAPIPATAPHLFAFRMARVVQRALLGPGGRIRVRYVACAPAGGSVDATVGARFATRIAGPRTVSLHVDRIETRAARPDRACGWSELGGA